MRQTHMIYTEQSKHARIINVKPPKRYLLMRWVKCRVVELFFWLQLLFGFFLIALGVGLMSSCFFWAFSFGREIKKQEGNQNGYYYKTFLPILCEPREFTFFTPIVVAIPRSHRVISENVHIPLAEPNIDLLTPVDRFPAILSPIFAIDIVLHNKVFVNKKTGSY